MNSLIEKAKKVSFESECYSVSGTSVEVEFENNNLKSLSCSENMGSALRIVKDGKIGFSTTTKENDEDNLINKALEVSQFGKNYEQEFYSQSEISDVNCYNAKIKDLPIEEMVDVCRDIVNSINEYDSNILAFSSLSRGTSNIRLTNSKGLDKEYKKSFLYISGGGRITEEGNFLTIYDYNISNSLFSNEFIKNLKKGIVRDFEIAKTNVSLKSGKYPVIISPRALSDLLSPVSASANGKNVQKGVSLWGDKIGEKIFDSRISIYDDATKIGAYNSVPFDDEGVPTQKTPLIENGVLKSFYHNLETASQLSFKPTGNGMRGRSIRNLPSPSLTNLCVSPGETTYDDMIKDVKEGVFIDELMGTFTSNHLAGQVSGNISLGYKIENGVLAGRIKDAMFSVNIFEVFKNNISKISKETVSRGSSSFPYFLLNDITISCKT